MVNVTVNTKNEIGKIKPMHAVNNGPVKKNFELFKAAGIPYARTHDSAFCENYGGEHIVDIMAIFPDFSKDAEAEDSYDFICTDEFLQTIESAGTKVFYRLGSKIEHQRKKYGTLVPPDMNKWAVICEHIVRHYNEGWANGFHMNIEYWEIWNEPDLDAEDSDDKKTWGGTYDQFYDLYEITARHLKKCFPNIKVGGPALANPWGIKEGSFCDRFFKRITERNVPIDFFSWHAYGCKRGHFAYCLETVEKTLEKFNLQHIESILNEWNYIENWSDKLDKSIETYRTMKGAAFTSMVMLMCQNSSVDLLMYYDARPCKYNGIFDFYTGKPFKCYYTFTSFNELYKMGIQTECNTDCEDVYAVSAKDEKGNNAVIVSYFSEDDNAEAKHINIDFKDYSGKLGVFVLDEDRDLEKIIEFNGNAVGIDMKVDSVVMVKTVE